MCSLLAHRGRRIARIAISTLPQELSGRRGREDRQTYDEHAGHVGIGHASYGGAVLRMLRTRKWIALTSLAALIIVGFGALSWWQWGRAQRDMITHQPTAPLNQVVTGTEPLAATNYGKRVRVTGTFDAAHQVLVRRDESTFVIVTPMLRPAEPAVAVARGTVNSLQDPAITQIPAGQVTLAGTLQPFDGDPGGESDLPPGQVRHLTAAAVGVNPLVGGWIAQVPAQEGLTETGVAYGPEAGTGLRAQNVTYAIQWILFAGFVVYFWWRIFKDDLNAESDGAGVELPTGSGERRSTGSASQDSSKVTESKLDPPRKKVY